MKDQNLNILVPEERDEDFLVEFGMVKRLLVFFLAFIIHPIFKESLLFQKKN